jgi:hypothetical protein
MFEDHQESPLRVSEGENGERESWECRPGQGKLFELLQNMMAAGGFGGKDIGFGTCFEKQTMTSGGSD